MEEQQPVNYSSQRPEEMAPGEQQIEANEQPRSEVEKMWNGVAQDIQAMLTEMSDLRRDFETKIQYDNSKEQQIENLYRELQGYREGLHFRILKPILIDLIGIYDDMGRLIESMSQVGDSFNSPMAQHLVLFQESIEEILRRNDVDAFTSEGDLFLANQQRVLRTIPTSNPELDRHIARRVRKGFECAQRLLRPELIEVYKYIPDLSNR